MPAKKTKKLARANFSRMQILIFVVIFGVVGGYAIIKSFAAAPSRSTGSSLSLAMVNDVNGDGQANYKDTIKFNVTTSYKDDYAPWLTLICTQNGTTVYTANTGYGALYPWPWTQQMTLTSNAWTGGAADCHAQLYYQSGKHPKNVTLATLDFHVNP